MVEIIEILRQERRNIEKLLRVMEQELTSSIEATLRTTGSSERL